MPGKRGNTRSDKAVVYLEPEIMAAAAVAANKSDRTVSGWIRKKILDSLLADGFLTEEALLKLVS